MTHPTPTHPSPSGPRHAAGWDEMPVPQKPRPKLPHRCTNPAPHDTHPVRPRRLAWTPFQCAGRPSLAEQDRELAEAFDTP